MSRVVDPIGLMLLAWALKGLEHMDDPYLWRGQVTAIHATAKALLVRYEDGEFWIPQVVIHDDSEVWKKGDEGELVIPQRIAEEKGMC